MYRGILASISVDYCHYFVSAMRHHHFPLANSPKCAHNQLFRTPLSNFDVMDFAPATLLGAIGDTLTFVGAILLLVKDLLAVREFREIESARKHLKEFPDVPFRAAYGTLPANNPEDLQTAILTHYSRRAVLATALLTVGFLLLLITRLVEKGDKDKGLKTGDFTKTLQLWRGGHSNNLRKIQL
jgi:hypothetical protein